MNICCEVYLGEDVIFVDFHQEYLTDQQLIC